MLCSRDISRLRADVAANCNVFLRLCKEAGLNVLVTQTVRDDEYQEQLYAQNKQSLNALPSVPQTGGIVPNYAGVSGLPNLPGSPGYIAPIEDESDGNFWLWMILILLLLICIVALVVYLFFIPSAA